MSKLQRVDADESPQVKLMEVVRKISATVEVLEQADVSPSAVALLRDAREELEQLAGCAECRTNPIVVLGMAALKTAVCEIIESLVWKLVGN